ncbi:unnamed protein product [Medioppia subpectinata]|uniref:Uncharacterized protein n=1 Tax=Medioppia subpectinata TaxID=1979941 RepID=A0A7R9KNB8_9ACAR|nr:unnamed protein product [Medioppia subpectinata]CAG2106690.1 unnamed protein product [Medioppia subpectinata]
MTAKNKRSSPSMEQPLSDDSIDDNNNNNENIITYPIENIEEKSELRISETPDKYNQQMDEWLRREYYENIAKALATMRRKRSEEEFDFNPNNDENDGINAIEDSDFIADNLIANDIKESDNEETNEIDIDSQRFSRINTKLESIEDSLLSEAIGLIRETAQKGSQSEAESNKIENRLNAAYNIEDMRTILDDLHKTVDKINVENDRNNDLIETANREVATDLIDNQIDYQNTNDLVNSLSKSESVNNCFAIEMFSSDCSSVADLMPNSRLRESFTEACNWHHICYTCGEVYGLLSSDCDSGFLEASRLACNDSPSCETFSRLVLTPLRQSRVFYKSSVPKTCFQYQCIKDYLFDSQNNKR